MPQEKELIASALHQEENWLYSDGQSCDKQTYEDHLKELQRTANPFYSRFRKIDDATNYLKDAWTAFNGYEQTNAELMAHGSPAQLNEIRQKIQESTGYLQHIDVLVNQYSIQSCDAFDLEAKKTTVNKNYDQLNNVLSAIKKDKENREKEEKKKVDDEEKKRKEAEKKTKDDQSKNKMEVEHPVDQSSKIEEEESQPQFNEENASQ